MYINSQVAQTVCLWPNIVCICVMCIYLPFGGVSGRWWEFLNNSVNNAPNGLKLHRKVNKYTIHIYRLYFLPHYISFIILIKMVTNTQLGLPVINLSDLPMILAPSAMHLQYFVDFAWFLLKKHLPCVVSLHYCWGVDKIKHVHSLLACRPRSLSFDFKRQVHVSVFSCVCTCILLNRLTYLTYILAKGINTELERYQQNVISIKLNKLS